MSESAKKLKETLLLANDINTALRARNDRLVDALERIATDCRARDYAEHFTAQEAWNLLSLIERNARSAISIARHDGKDAVG